MWLAIFLLAIFFYFFIRPAWRIWRVYNNARKQARDMQNAFRRAAGLDPEAEKRARDNEQVRRKGGWSTPEPRRKKIDPAVGEYIKFQEVTVDVTETSTDGSETTYTRVSEQQIEDVKWEDVG
ncbi:MAG: hypothetical protein K2L97_08025 [Muribaculaceae bacterium]|nr:hypothetical protein [Muribaculaceae bacterium]